ncbi:hypothetical protein EOD39_3983 [Acipenser ruthenus]|uniref:Splicing factor 45 n=1 Tax=Acipenser ruthenus TaxID=7906 RepID=A0A444UKD5_ACIRT|nr:hypothetical protein EOD39_3983 [Acipenser ruthenus]
MMEENSRNGDVFAEEAALLSSVPEDFFLEDFAKEMASKEAVLTASQKRSFDSKGAADVRFFFNTDISKCQCTGKTSTLIKYAQQRPHLRFLYAAFNKSVAVQAKRMFPSNVDCKTIHSMADQQNKINTCDCSCDFSLSVIMDIVLSQARGKILVGEPHQQIYTFRGAVNALYEVPHTHIYYLTQFVITLRDSQSPPASTFPSIPAVRRHSEGFQSPPASTFPSIPAVRHHSEGFQSPPALNLFLFPDSHFLICPRSSKPTSSRHFIQLSKSPFHSMKMSLYDDLGVETSDSKTEGWSKNFKLLQSQLQVKKAALTQAKSQRTKQSSVLAPVIDLKRGSSSDDRQIQDTPPHIAAGLKDPVPSGFSSGEVLIPLADEYDPMFPNDYEKVVKRHREERQRQRELERQKEIEEREKYLMWHFFSFGEILRRRKDRHEATPTGFSRRPDPESDEDEDFERERQKRGMGGAAIAPPTSLVEKDRELIAATYPYEEEARPRIPSSKAAIPPPMYDEPERPRSPPGPTNSFLANMGGTVAHKIMQKYGFREGQGLGKHEQGLSTALSVEKTSKRGGKIIVGDAADKLDTSKKADGNPLTEILKCPTKVVLLRNMVGSGEVDEDLEGETKEECEKYGKVVKCVIFEIPGVNDDAAVRIFLEFERVESAIKAVVDLNGRYFGGRVVKACFYNLDKFRVLDLGEQM